MVSNCVADKCHNRKVKTSQDSNLSFHRFPLNNPNLLAEWLKKLNKENFTPQKYSKLCSDHFEESCFYIQRPSGRKVIKADSIPTKFVHIKENKQTTYQFGEMPSSCCAHGCYNSQTKAKKHGWDISFHKFPLNDNLLLLQWIVNIKRKDFTPNKYSKLCSDHFEDDCFTYPRFAGGLISCDRGKRVIKPDAIPTKFAHNNKLRNNHEKSTADKNQSEKNVACIGDVTSNNQSIDSISSNNQCGESISPNQHVSCTMEEGDEDTKSAPSEGESTLEPSISLLVDAGTQTDQNVVDTLLEINTALTKELEELKKLNQTHKNRIHFRMECINDDKLLKSLTGFTKNVFQTVYSFLCLENNVNPVCDISPRNQFFLFLVYLRTGISQNFLSVLFGVHQTTISTICNNLSRIIYTELKSINIWPSRETVEQNVSPVFIEGFPKCRVILDVVEFPIQRPAKGLLRQETFNGDKNMNTLKALVGITSAGGISFISDLSSGGISDKELFMKSGILNLLEPDDLVLADEGFEIESEMKAIKCNLVSHHYLDDEIELSNKETKNKKFSHYKVKVQRIISQIKAYKIFEGQIRNILLPVINEYFYIVASFLNFGSPLINSKK